MTQDDQQSGTNQGNTAFNKLNLDVLVRPAASIPTAMGKLFLYSLRVSDIDAAAKISGASPDERIRGFMPNVASFEEQTSFKQERKPISTEQVAALSNYEVECFSEQYIALLLQSHRLDKERTELSRAPVESATAYLERLLQNEVQKGLEVTKHFRKMIEPNSSSIFSEVRRNTTALESTLGAFDRLASGMDAIAPQNLDTRFSSVLQDGFSQRAKERAEELEMVKLTGRMTAESAATLKSLAEAATVLLVQMEERDRKAERATGYQIKIAVWSVFVSALFSLLALVVTTISYYQDKLSNQSDDKWQEQVISAVRDATGMQSRLTSEVILLRSKLTELEARVQKPSSIRSGSAATRGNDLSTK